MQNENITEKIPNGLHIHVNHIFSYNCLSVLHYYTHCCAKKSWGERSPTVSTNFVKEAAAAHAVRSQTTTTQKNYIKNEIL